MVLPGSNHPSRMDDGNLDKKSRQFYCDLFSMGKGKEAQEKLRRRSESHFTL